MKKIICTLLFLGCTAGLALFAQTVPQGMNYQAVARDAQGMPMADRMVDVRISLTGAAPGSAAYFSEVHRVKTDELGLFQIVIGQGENLVGTFARVPWAKEQIWMDIEMAGNNGYKLVSRTQLLSVPYAMHAETAYQLVEGDSVTLRNQSIYWTTSGNSKTRPPVHFLGTRDENDLVLKTDATTRMVITADGQTQIYGGEEIKGEDDDVESYPLVVNANNQGVWIKIDERRDNSTNFVTFEDKQGIQGRIEGETEEEVILTYDFISTNAAFIKEIASNLTEGTGDNTEGAGLSASGLGAGAAAGSFASAISELASWAFLIGEHAKYLYDLFSTLGVTYESNGADYAEWLERMPDERDMNFGEVVGVKGGKISLNTEDADHLMVISKSPMVLGNSPEAGKEQQYEKVAFMGQIPVKVVGEVKIGDYILPTGNNDGFAIAVSPEEMQVGDYGRIVGVAWQASGKSKMNYINTAVGINSNDLSQKLESLHAKVDNIMNYLEGKEPLQTGENARMEDMNQLAQAPQTTYNKLMSDQQFDRLLDQNAGMIRQTYAQVKDQLTSEGYDLDKYPMFGRMFGDPVNFLKQTRRDPRFVSHWALFDRTLEPESSED